jgi:hypothetical protein
MSTAPGWYADPTDPRLLRWWDGTAWTAHVQSSASPVPALAVCTTPTQQAPQAPEQQVTALRQTVEDLRRELQALQSQIVETRDLFLLQEVGLYQYAHPLDSSAQYKDALAELDRQMQMCIKSGGAVTGAKKWVINGSESDGAKMVADFQKLMLRAYNTEADNAVRTLKPYSLDSATQRLEKLRASISKLGASMKIQITEEYHRLRVRELQLTADYLAKVAEEKEREREERARLKEEEAARREYEREQARLEKERSHYQAALDALRKKGDEAAAADAEEKIAEIQQAIEGVLKRAANVRAGYVYIISNVGSFGDSVVKIGMTRRLDPMDRVRELGDASVPFRFDVHAIIFSEDAVGLETALHREFADRRVNLVNMHREYFYATPHEVKAALAKLQGSILSFVDAPEALEWHQSETTRRARAAVGGDVIATVCSGDGAG